MKYRIDIEIDPGWHEQDRAYFVGSALQDLVYELRGDEDLIDYKDYPVQYDGRDIGTAGLVEVAE